MMRSDRTTIAAIGSDSIAAPTMSLASATASRGSPPLVRRERGARVGSESVMAILLTMLRNSAPRLDVGAASETESERNRTVLAVGFLGHALAIGKLRSPHVVPPGLDVEERLLAERDGNAAADVDPGIP